MTEKKKPEKLAPIICIWCYSPLTAKDMKTHPCTQPDFLDKQSSFIPTFPNKNKKTKKVSQTDLDWYISRLEKANYKSPPWSGYYDEDNYGDGDDDGY